MGFLPPPGLLLVHGRSAPWSASSSWVCPPGWLLTEDRPGCPAHSRSSASVLREGLLLLAALLVLTEPGGVDRTVPHTPHLSLVLPCPGTSRGSCVNALRSLQPRTPPYSHSLEACGAERLMRQRPYSQARGAQQLQGVPAGPGGGVGERRLEQWQQSGWAQGPGRDGA